MTARAFENYIIDKLNGYDTVNDYLANINSLDSYADAMITGMANGKDAIDIYPYLLESELQPVSRAFDELFSTIKTRETDRGVAMYSRTGGIPKEIVNFVQQSISDDSNAKKILSLGIASQKNTDTIKEKTGIEVDGYERILDNYSIRHIIKEHGEGNESRENHIPVTPKDIGMIPEIVEFPDSISDVSDRKQNVSIIRYQKRINGFVFYLEEIRTGKQQLVPKTMYKVKTETPRATSKQEGDAHTSETFPASPIKNVPSNSEEVKSATAKKNGTYLKAPNGKDTRLNPEQWAMVRTQNFKKWFGDWESAAKYRSINELNVIKINAARISKENAREAYLKLNPVRNLRDQREIRFVHYTFGKIVRHRGNELILRIIPSLEEIAQTAVPIYSEAERNPEKRSNVQGYQNYLGKVDIDSQAYFVRLTTRELKDTRNELHNVFVSNIEIVKAGSENDISTISNVASGFPLADFDNRLNDWLQKVKQDSDKSSKIIDENGEPLVVYHGTKSDFNVFDMGDEGGIFFTTNKNNANDYAGYWPNIGQADGGNVMPVYLSIKNPYHVTLEQWNNAEGFDLPEAKNVGYDGYIINGQDGGNTYVAFSPKQIKSATGNIGTFNPDNPDIRYRRNVPARGLSTNRIQQIVDKATSFLKAAPKIHVVQHISEIPVAVLEDMEKNGMLDDNMESDVQGFAWEGEVWLISDNLTSNQEAVYVLMHELTHGGLGKFFQANTPNVKLRSIRVRYKSLMDAIYETYGKEVRQIAKTTHTHLDVSTLTGRRQASEEWLCNQAYGAQPKWYDRLAAIFHDILRAIGFNVKLSDAEVRTVLQDAFRSFGKQEAQPEYARYARKESDEFSRQLDDYASGYLKPRVPVTIGNTPDVLERLGMKQLPLVITQNTIKKVTADKHGISLETLKKLPLHLADPIMIFDSATEADSLVVMTELKQDGKTIVAAIHLSTEIGRNVVNDVASVYGKDSDRIFIKWIKNGLLRYMNKKKSRVWSVTSGLQLPTVRGSIQGFKKKILFEYDLVKKNEDVKYTRKGELPAENSMQKTRAFERIMEGFAREINVEREQMKEGVLVEHMFMKEQNALTWQ